MDRSNSFITQEKPVSPSTRLASVDALRTAAFLLVVLCHFAGMVGASFPNTSPARAICDVFARYGSLGTDTFFLLSAFLLSRSLRNGSSWREAVTRRLAKIYPGFLAVLTIYLVLAPFAPWVSKIPGDAMAAVFYVAANILLLPGLIPIVPIVTVAWSLSFVVFGYLLVGALHHFADGKGWNTATRCAMWAVVAILFGLFDMSGNYMRMVLFPVGGLLAELTPLLTHSPRFRRWCALGALPGLFLILEVPGFYSSTLGLALFITAWIFSPRMALRSQLLAELGNLSYAVFLTHGLVLRPVRWAGPTDGSLIDLMSMLLASLSLIGVVALGFRTLVLDRLQESLPAHPSFARS